MSDVATATPLSAADIDSGLSGLRDELGNLGINLQVRDTAGLPVAEFQPRCGLCRLIGGRGEPCLRSAAETALRALDENEPVDSRSAAGCCLLGVGVYRRRRAVAAAVACYPPLELTEEESFARFCDIMELDLRAAGTAVGASCRHGAGERGNLARLLGWMVLREQELRVAREELRNLSVNLVTTYEELSLLYRISGSIRVTQPQGDFLQKVCKELREVMNISAAAAVVYAHLPGAGEDAVTVAGQIDLAPAQIAALASSRLAQGLASGGRAPGGNRGSPPRWGWSPPRSGGQTGAAAACGRPRTAPRGQAFPEAASAPVPAPPAPSVGLVRRSTGSFPGGRRRRRVRGRSPPARRAARTAPGPPCSARSPPRAGPPRL